MTGSPSTPCFPARKPQTTTKPSSTLSSKERVVRRKLADGTIKEYRYARKPTRSLEHFADNSLAALIVAYRRSPEWSALRPNSRAHYSRYLRHLEDAWHRPLAAVTRKLLLDMRDAVALGWGPSAANCFIQTASAVFAWGRNRGWVEYSPLDRAPRLPGGHFPAWTMDQVAVALTAFPEALRRVVTLGLYTGQRRGDLIAMSWGAYDGSVITLRQIKTGTPLVIPAHAALRTELERWKMNRTSTLILTSPRGLPWSGTHLSTSLAAAVRDAGLPAGLNVHGFRKLAAANLAEAGCSTHEIAAITGHQSLSMVSLYTASARQTHLARAAILRLENGEANGKTREKRQ